MYHTYRDVHPQRSNIEPVVLKYSIGVRKFYASWVKTFLPLSPHSEYKLHRAFSTTAVSLSPRHLDGDLKGEVERGKSSVSSSIAPRELSSCDSSGIPEERRIRSISVAFANAFKKKKYISFSPRRESPSDISQFFWNEVPFPRANTEHFATLPPLCETLHDEYRYLATRTIRVSPVKDVAKFEWCGGMIPRILWRVVTIFFHFKKLLRWLIIEESFFFLIDWLHVINILNENIYIYIYF